MGANRTLVKAAMVVACGALTAQADGPTGRPDPAAAVAPSISEVPCTPVDTMWPTSTSGPYELQPPRLAVAVTDLRPKDAVVLLDGRVTGRSRYFNGKKGFLYLEPGRYTMGIELDGYRSEAFVISARPGCRFDIRLRMEKARGTGEVSYPKTLGKGVPTQWIWGPVGSTAAPPPSSMPHGPDPSLRPDLGGAPPQVPRPEALSGSLRLRVEPATASVFLDGSFLATAHELDLMATAVAVPAGQHVLEMRAPGFAPRSEEINVVAGELVELHVELSASAP